jgi:hypothetical protein
MNEMPWATDNEIPPTKLVEKLIVPYGSLGHFRVVALMIEAINYLRSPSIGRAGGL